MKRLLLILFSLTLASIMSANTIKAWVDPETGIRWLYEIVGESVRITSGNSNSSAISRDITGELLIPSHIGGYPVTEIGSAACYDCYKLTSVIIPKGVTTIGYRAFANCNGLKSVVFPEGLKSIGGTSFNWCTSLTSVTFPKSVTSIGSNAFTGLQAKTFLNKATFLGPPPSCGSNAGFNTDIVYTREFSSQWEAFRLKCPKENLSNAEPFISTTSWSCIGGELRLISVYIGNQVVSKTSYYLPKEEVTVTATQEDGYIFLGWSSSDIDVSQKTNQTLKFSAPDKEETSVIVTFLPEQIQEEWINNEVEEQILEGKLLTAEQAATKTSATINQKVADGELITSNQLQVMAMEAPVIAVEDGKAKVGVSLKRAESLEGEWEEVVAEEAEITDEGAISVSVPADGNAAFYKFVVPEKQ